MRTWFKDSSNRLRTGWRIVVMVIAIAAVIFLVNWGWKAAGLPSRKETGPWMFLLFTTLISGGIFLVIVALLKGFESENTCAIRLPFQRSAWRDVALGTVLGSTVICIIVGTAVLFGYGQVRLGTAVASDVIVVILPMLVSTFLLAAGEELTLRGYVLRQISLGLNPVAAIIITGILFGLLHAANPGANWQGLVCTATGGILMAVLVVRTGSLWLLIGYHFGWNAAAFEVFGLDLSGFGSETSLFTGTLTGPDWLSGGSYGFEASFPTEIIEVLILTLVLMVHSIVNGKQTAPPD
jgi:membrane protease YdiL (CAAX protease family)